MDGFERFTVPEFYLQVLGNYVNPLCAVVGWSPNCIRFCSMHVVNLGIVQWINASTIFTLIEDYGMYCFLNECYGCCTLLVEHLSFSELKLYCQCYDSKWKQGTSGPTSTLSQKLASMTHRFNEWLKQHKIRHLAGLILFYKTGSATFHVLVKRIMMEPVKGITSSLFVLR